MEEKKQETNSNIEIKKIIATYEKVYNFFIKPWIFFIAFGVSLTVFTFANISSDFDYIKEVEQQYYWKTNFNNWYKWNSVYLPEESINKNSVEIKALWWVYFGSGDTISSRDNLVKAWNLFLPNNFSIEEEKIENISKISTWYDTNDLEYIFEELIFSDMQISIEDQWENYLESVDESFKKDFWLSCAFGSKITDRFCNENINNFLNNLPTYNILDDIEWFEKIFEQLSEEWYKDRLCSWIENQVFYSFNTNSWYEEFFEECWKDYEENFNKIQELEKVFDELNWSINSETYSNQNINNMKIITLMRQIANNPRDFTRISIYSSFIENLLIENKLDSKYKEIVYYFNEIYVDWFLENIADREQRSERLWRIERVENRLSSINEWDRLEWYEWVLSKINNENLISFINEQQEESTTTRTRRQTVYSIYSDFISNFSDYSEVDRQVDNSNRIVNSRWIVRNSEWNRYQAVLVMENEWYSFYIKQANISNPELNRNVNGLINSEGSLQMSTFLSVVSDFRESIEIDNRLCRQIENLISNDHINWNLSECSEDYVEIDRDWTIFKYIIDDNSIEEFEVSNDMIQEMLNERYSDQNISWNQIVRFIQSSANIEIEEDIQISSSDIRSMQRRFAQYMWISPSLKENIEEDKYILSFEHVWLYFYAEYEPNNNHSLNITKALNSDEEDVLDEEVQFYLVSAEEVDINRFIEQTEDYVTESLD